ncbi:hypothetical protein HNR59_001208 [Aquamicrobium lusatiense]|uniref:Uncharacterized protein n=1 Tax=Aquamicrobium lusatiense TaxID=89772 RepID=A0A7W9S2S3_9HYPH|nr:hypothetical protein [Aquamicrobium lusatiense]MBB6011863.1 hypothetical protein [Aquamicrobium lusatiense]
MADWSPIYKTGTATLTNGQTAVTGQGTSWNTAGLRAGDQIKAAGFSVTIAAINPNGTGLTLAEGWPGVTRTALPYEILRVSDADRLIAAHADLMAALVPNLTSLGGLTLAANKGIHATGAGALATHNLTAFMRGVLGSADGSAARLALGANDAANLNAGILPAARLPFVAGTSNLTLTATTTSPTISSYAARICTWIKLGQLVLCNFDIRPTVTDVGSGSVQIDGVPFVPAGGRAVSAAIGLNSLTSVPVNIDISAVGQARMLTNPGGSAPTSVLKTGANILFFSAAFWTAA